jgi:protein AbiQ
MEIIVVKYIFLTQQFYDDYSHCEEIEQKKERPYVLIQICVNGIDFAIPFRSNVKHKHVFWTDKDNLCGLDFSKAVVIEDKKYIDSKAKPYIRPNERRALFGKDHDVERGLLDYIEEYKKAKMKPNKHSKKRLLQYSTLQYFEKYI